MYSCLWREQIFLHRFYSARFRRAFHPGRRPFGFVLRGSLDLVSNTTWPARLASTSVPSGPLRALGQHGQRKEKEIQLVSCVARFPDDRRVARSLTLVFRLVMPALCVEHVCPDRIASAHSHAAALSSSLCGLCEGWAGHGCTLKRCC